MEPEVRFLLHCVTVARVVPTLCTLFIYLRRRERTCLKPLWLFIGFLWGTGFLWYAHAAFVLEDLRLAGRILLGFGAAFDGVFFLREDLERLWAKIDRDDEDLLLLSSPLVPPPPPPTPTRRPWTRRPRWPRSTFGRYGPPPPRYSEFPEMGETVVELGTIDPAVLRPQRDQADAPSVSSSRR
ncbi:hypothetical protein ISF_05590 [Cordyceps fumosorosea ARSEF 2679]|uniref:Uncharacterized protein n=1 Tax=Cordyceps fumosorosea (strain ARSEF 2679) TaxID=1081104 RepID=A0A167UEN7_CORFA|nr:hypothetical protein ISF_05590 [Cordyceps fumosorosea ARSEF 2679]OAA61511.1 hypothetical protein ISF_05590 [Cordyceps fumosorosea ARSEF 2679]